MGGSAGEYGNSNATQAGKQTAKANAAANFKANVKETTAQISQAAEAKFDHSNTETYDAAIADAWSQMGR